MNESEILSRVLEVAQRHLDWTGPVSRDMPLVETFELDSLRQLTLVIEIENAFRIRLDDQDEQSLCTVGDLLEVIGRKIDLAPRHGETAADLGTGPANAR